MGVLAERKNVSGEKKILKDHQKVSVVSFENLSGSEWLENG